MEKLKLKLDRKTAQGLAEGDYDDSIYKVVKDEITGTGRWTINHLLTIQTLSNNLFWQARYNVGSTESQDESAFEYGSTTFGQVFEEKIEVVVYK